MVHRRTTTAERFYEIWKASLWNYHFFNVKKTKLLIKLVLRCNVNRNYNKYGDIHLNQGANISSKVSKKPLKPRMSLIWTQFLTGFVYDWIWLDVDSVLISGQNIWPQRGKEIDSDNHVHLMQNLDRRISWIPVHRATFSTEYISDTETDIGKWN